jgi:hypothetical protein
VPALTFEPSATFALANDLASCSFRKVSVARACERFPTRSFGSNETYHVSLDLLGRGPGFISLALKPQPYKPKGHLKTGSSLAAQLLGSTFRNGSLSLLARRRTASGIRLSNLAIASTLLAPRIRSRSLFSSSGVHGGVGVAFISPSPLARSRPGGGWPRSGRARRPGRRPMRRRSREVPGTI